MTFRLKFLGIAVGTACTALLAGCFGSYYTVRDPGSGRVYYTTEVDNAGNAVKFKDAKTGSAVTLQNSEVKEISEDEFAKGSTAPAAAPATPAAATPASPQ